LEHSRRQFLFGASVRLEHGAEQGLRKARIEPNCLATRGVVCRTCSEHCEPRAIRFRLQTAGRALPLIEDALCNACGECVRVCPVQAMALQVVAAAVA
jgi:ferredoxin-type protein NapF